jgi:hypothetical protein
MLALEIDGYDKGTINDVFGMGQDVCKSSDEKDS